MRSLLILCLCLLCLPVMAKPLSVFVGLFSKHGSHDSFVDYDACRYGTCPVRPLNEGSFKANHLMGFMFKPSHDLRFGFGMHKNTYYDPVWFLFADVVRPLPYGFDLHGGAGAHHGYRPALVQQDPSASMKAGWSFIPQGGIGYQFAGSHSFSLDAFGNDVVNLSYIFGLP